MPRSITRFAIESALLLITRFAIEIALLLLIATAVGAMMLWDWLKDSVSRVLSRH
jgi:hypothetical protein